MGWVKKETLPQCSKCLKLQECIDSDDGGKDYHSSLADMLSRIHGGHMGTVKERACDILFCFLLHLQLTEEWRENTSKY